MPMTSPTRSRVIDKRAAGPFNLAAEPPVGRDDVATALGARPVHIPSGVLGALVDLSWRAGLQHIAAAGSTWHSLCPCWTVRAPAANSAGFRNGPRLMPWQISWTASRTGSHQQPAFAATLDARSSATRCDRGVDLIAIGSTMHRLRPRPTWCSVLYRESRLLPVPTPTDRRPYRDDQRRPQFRQRRAARRNRPDESRSATGPRRRGDKA